MKNQDKNLLPAKNISFTIPGDPVGYYTQGSKPNWERMKAYRAYKIKIQWYARKAGINLPLVATKDSPIIINTVAYFKNGIHCDPENVRKGVSDALFYAGKGQSKGSGDKYCGGFFPPPKYDKNNPRVEVKIIEG